MITHPNVLQAFYSAIWAILPEKLSAIQEFLEYRARGGTYTSEELQARIGDRQERSAGGAGGVGVAVIPVFGVISHRGGMDATSEPLASTTAIGRDFRAALADPDIGSIVLHVDSPGGTVDGVAQLSDLIHASRGQKPIVAVADALAASAAYFIAASADEIVATPEAMVGSIGVFTVHTDHVKMAETLGVKQTVIRAGKFKAETHPSQPLSEEARAALQEQVDAAYDLFVKAVARGRGVKPSDVRNGFGEGRVVTAKAALEQGMIDRIGTFDDTVARLSRPQGRAAAGGRRVDLERKRLALHERGAL